MRQYRSALACAVSLAVLATAPFAHAGGTGANMLLVVNPNDENALRLANTYAALRNIPANNIVYIAPPSTFNYANIKATYASFTSTYVNQLPGIITQRGLDSQIDYIATIGQPTNVSDTSNNIFSLNYGLAMLTEFKNGMTSTQAIFRSSELLQNAPTTTSFDYTPGSNPAIHHATVYGSNVQWYMSGTVGYYGRNATVTVQQLIDNLNRNVPADGTKPVGTVYFENNTDVRSTTRSPYWPSVQAYMSAHGIPYLQELNTSGSTPKNRADVRGAVVGSAGAVLPNGSTYIPGSWADDLTSNGCDYGTSNQTKAGRFLVSGAAGTTGTVTEPYAIQSRFTYASVYVFANDGSTLGEATAKSIQTPDLQMFQGDMLSQAYADVPKVTLGSLPAITTPVSGSLSFSATASLTSPTLATGIANLQLYVDGKPNGTPVSAATGSFTLNTATLADGLHELRVVATNNTQAASQGYTLSSILVNNKGESVTTTGTTFAAAWNQQLQIPVTALPGTGGPIARIDLRCLGRTVAQLPAAAGNLALDATKLAFGDNTLTPVAVFADNSEVAGLPLTVTRAFNKLTGQPVTPVALQNPGFQYDYWTGHAGKTLATTDFTGTPDYTLHGTSVLQIAPNQNTSNPDPIASGRNIPDAYRNVTGGSNGGIAARITASFQTTTEGEYAFCFNSYQCRWTSLQLLVDGAVVTSYDTWVSGSSFNSQGLESGTADTSRMAYLLPGEHTLTFNLANYIAQTGSGNPSYGDSLFSVPSFLTLTYPDGTAKIADASFFYTVPVPEPATLLLLPLGLLTLAARRPRRPI